MPDPTVSQIFKRGTGFFNPDENPHAAVTFVGVGGIGSFAATAVAKLGVPNITLIDPDKVEVHNAPNQFHAIVNTGEAKVAALAAEIERHIGTVPTDYIAKITEDGWATADEFPDAELPDELSGVVVSGFDSMTARRMLWEQKLHMNPAVQLYIDGRIVGDYILLYALCPYDLEAIEHYEKTLHSDDDAEEGSCTERGLIDVGFSVGALISRAVRFHFAGKDVDPITYMSVNSLELRKGDWIK